MIYSHTHTQLVTHPDADRLFIDQSLLIVGFDGVCTNRGSRSCEGQAQQHQQRDQFVSCLQVGQRQVTVIAMEPRGRRGQQVCQLHEVERDKGGEDDGELDRKKEKAGKGERERKEERKGER